MSSSFLPGFRTFLWLLFHTIRFFMPVLCAPGRVKKRWRSVSTTALPARIHMKILERLRQHQVKAAFFCMGKSIKENEDILKKIKEEGHVIGNHSYSHSKWFDFCTSQAMLEDMQR
jgi:hypothetical protein